MSPSSDGRASDETLETSTHCAVGSGHLLIAFGAEGSSTHLLRGKPSVVLGRGNDAEVCLPDASVSRLHARLTLGDVLTIEDLNSKNGVTVSGARLPPGQPAVVRPGQFFEVGAVAVIVQVLDEAAAPLLAEDAPALEPESVLEAGDHQVLVCGTVQRTLRVLDRIARSNISVLLQGETGVGKDVFAELIHARSERRDKPLVRVHCAAIAETLFESELFGHERGAFTGATRDRKGLLESAEGGTAFLDEIGDLPLGLQVKLLRALEDRRIVRVGSVEPRRINVRFVAATNQDLNAAVASGAFRKDLFFRLAGMVLTIPPLRERRDEVLPLAKTFLAQACKDLPTPSWSDSAIEFLQTYSFPGNVRELRGMIERAVLLAADGVLRPEHLQGAGPLTTPAAPSAPHSAEALQILEALQRCAGNQTDAARLLGISRRTLINRIIAYGIPRPRKGG